MATNKHEAPLVHTNAWIAQTWLSFALAVTAMAVGILYLPVDNWIKGYLSMGMVFSVGSTMSLSKTIRDVEESKRMLSRIEDAKLERLLVEHDPYKP